MRHIITNKDLPDIYEHKSVFASSGEKRLEAVMAFHKDTDTTRAFYRVTAGGQVVTEIASLFDAVISYNNQK